MAWQCVVELDAQRQLVSGSMAELARAVGNGADLRVGTEFIHNEHIDVTSDSAERIREVAEFAVTYLVDGRWAAGIMSLRQPVNLPIGFGERPSMSFFMYNQSGRQAIARPYLDGVVPTGIRGPAPLDTPECMPKYHTHDSWDAGTNAPSSNFTYDFDVFRYFVRDKWRMVLSHDEQGEVESGSIDELGEAFSSGKSIKVGVSGLCDDLAEEGKALPHEVFVETGSGYYYLEQKLFIAGSHPLVRVKPAVPMSYESGGWDFGCLVLRSDGRVVYRRCDPYKLEFKDYEKKCAVRWFVT